MRSPTVRKHRRTAAPHMKVACKPRGFLQAILSRQAIQVAKILDCSEGGMRLLAPEPMKVGETVRLDLQVPFLHAPSPLVARVLRCRERPASGGRAPSFEIGLEILKPGKDYSGMLKRLRDDPMLRQGTL